MQSLEIDSLLDLPRNELMEILKRSENPLSLLACISRQFNKLVLEFAMENPPRGSFDRAMWVRYGACPEVQPCMRPIPLPVYDACVTGQFICTFVPEFLQTGQPLGSENLHQFIRKAHGRERCMSDEQLPDERMGKLKGHWCILACEVQEETRGKECIQQKKIVERAGFKVPRLADVIVSLLVHSLLRKNNVFLSSAPGIRGSYTLVRETSSEDMRLLVGCDQNLGALRFRPLSMKSDFGTACSLSSLEP